MKKTLLITTALVAVMSVADARAEDLTLSEDINIVQKDMTVDENHQINNWGTIEGAVSKSDEGNLNITGGTITANTMSAAIYHRGNGDINIKDNANIIGGTVSDILIADEDDELYPPHGNTIVHTGNGDINIQGGKLTFDRAGIFKTPECENGGYGNMCQGTPKDVFGDINISGGTLNLDNDSAIYSKQKINITGGNISLLEESSIVSLEDINITGGTIDSKNSVIDADGSINIAGGTLNMTNPNGDYQQADSEGVGIFGGNVAIDGRDKVNISNGEVNLNQTSINGWNGIEVSGGTVNMVAENNNMSATLWSKGDIILSGGVINAGDAAINTFYNEKGVDSTGNIIISGATVNLAENTNLNLGSKGEIRFDSGVINIAQDAALDINDKYTEDWKFDVENTGTMKVAKDGVINLSGSVHGSLDGNGTVNFMQDGAKIKGNVSGSNLAFEADHSLSKAVIGTIGDLASLSINKGTLTYDKQTGKIGNLNVAGGLDIGTNTVNATAVDFKDNSKLALRVAAADNYGKINADTIKIGNDTTMKVSLDSGVVAYGETKNFDFLQGSVTGDFTNKITDNNRYNINFEDGSFKITGTATASDVVNEAGGSANNAKTAEAWDSLTSSSTASAGTKAVASVLNDLSQNNEQAYVEALTAVAPEVAPMVQKTQTETANQVFGAVSTRLTGGSVSTGGEGMSSGDNIFERAAMWVQGLFNHSKLDDTSKAKGFDADTNGIAFGFEKFVTDDVKAGIGYAYSQTDIDGFKRDTDVDTHTAIFYGEYKPSNWYVNGIATYGWSDYDESKNVAGIKVNADYDVETFGLQAMTGYDMNIKGINVTPETGLRYVHIKQDAYKDSADQRVSANDSDILTGVIGAKVSKDFELSNGMTVKPEAHIAATYDLFNDDVNSVVTLANGSAYAVDGEALDRFGMEFGAGVTAEVNDNVELSLGYEGKFREDYQDHTGLLNAKYKF